VTDGAARAAVAAVWLHQGLCRKLLDGGRHQRDVVAGMPLLGGRWAPAVLRTVGMVEVGLAVWSLSGRRRVAAAIVQTALLAGMNAAGLVWGRSAIADPTGMVLQNLVLLTLAWRVARDGSRR
jgi:hypothetical protein